MENVTLIPQKNSIDSLSQEEFQEMLNSWFHKKGILTELRLQLRFKLVNILKDTILGRNINDKSSQHITLFDQAINLIVAEYLMRNNCYYSLSIFNTEATFTGVFPEYPIKFTRTKGSYDNDSGLHFDRENVLQIMHLIGFTKVSEYYDSLLKMYFDSQENKSSLLCCLIKLISQSNVQVNDEDLQVLDAIRTDSDEIQFMEEIEKVLIKSNISSGLAKKLSHSIKSFYKLKSEEQKEELFLLINQIKSELTHKDKKLKEFHQSKLILQKQLLKVNRNYRKSKTQLENLLHKESSSNENILRRNRSTEQSIVKNAPLDDVKPDNVEQRTICKLPHCSEDCKSNIKKIDDLVKENMVLKKENGDQKDSLRKLFLIYKDLLQKYNDCQGKLNFLNSRVKKGLTEEIFGNFFLGESTEQEVLFEKNIDTEVTSESLTDEVLHQARTKLQQLEDETNQIEDKFKICNYVLR